MARMMTDADLDSFFSRRLRYRLEERSDLLIDWFIAKIPNIPLIGSWVKSRVRSRLDALIPDELFRLLDDKLAKIL